MAITFNNNFKIGIGAPIDSKYLNSLNQPYASTGATNIAIVESQRYVGLTVNIGNVEYWYKNGVTDTDLILKTVSTTGGTGTITGGTNGLSVFGKNIGLGGTLTGSTVITDARITPIGIVYNGDYSSTFVNESLVTKRYVDQELTGTTFHIPIYNATNDGIQESSLQFLQFSNKLYNPNDLIIEAQNGSNLYLVGSCGSSNTVLNLGYPALGSGFTITNICAVGQAANINLSIIPKGTGNINLITTASCVLIGNSGRCGLLYSTINRRLTLPQNAVVIGYGGDIATPNAPRTDIIGGNGYAASGFSGCGGHLYICGGDAGDGIGGQNCIGGDVIIESGLGTGTGATTTKKGNIKICNLPAKTAELNVLFYDNASGKISYGLASGGTGGGLITGGTNGLSVSGLNIKLGGTLNQCTQIVEGAGNTKGIEYFTDYSTGFSDRSLIDKGYANLINEKVSKVITQVAHGFIVGNVVGFSGGTYNKPIADGTYNGEILGIVTNVSGNTFELSQAGYITGLSGLTGNVTYFLSDVTAGLMTSTEPIILGHISKAMLIADSINSGWILPYAGYVVSTGSTESGSNTKRITLNSHGFAVNEVIGWSGGTYNKAIANGQYNGEVIGIVNKVLSIDVFDLTQAGYVSGLTGLTTNTTYFLSDVIAGQLVTGKTTTLGHVVRAVVVSDTPASGWVLPYPGYVFISGGSETTISGTTNYIAKFNATGDNVINSRIFDDGTNIRFFNLPAKTIETDIIYISSSGNISSGTTSTSTITGATNGLNINSGNAIGLGGALTGDTSLTGAFTLNVNGGAKLSTTCGYQISGATILCIPLNNFACGNLAVGYHASTGITTGKNNTAVGQNALQSNTTGCGNIATGAFALQSNTTGRGNIAAGYAALSGNTTGSRNIAIGCLAHSFGTTGGGGCNIAIGVRALQNNNSGFSNIGLGQCALFKMDAGGANNIAIGDFTLLNTTGGTFGNIAMGNSTMCGNMSGCFNVAIGQSALMCHLNGDYNVAIGNEALLLNVTGNTNVAIGLCAGYNETGSNKLYIANSATVNPLIYGDFALSAVTLNAKLTLGVVPTAGSTSDAVLVRNSGGEVRTVAGSALGDHNNIYAKTVVNVSTTLTTGSTYVQLVDSVSATTITLPATPLDGQVFRIKDAGTGALTNNITIARNGKLIDGAAANATINTDGGALELMYDTSLGSWYVFSFVN